MDEVWRHSTETVRSVLDVLSEDETREPRAYTTILTILQRLEAKGLVTRTRSGRADVYAPTVRKQEYLSACADAEVSRLLERYGELALVQFARRVEEIDAERREALRRIADP
jgi:predicted transcriptional regulator